MGTRLSRLTASVSPSPVFLASMIATRTGSWARWRRPLRGWRTARG